MRVSENLRAGRGHISNQGEVWNTVNAYHESESVYSPTSNLCDLFDVKKGELEPLLKQFSPDEGANGVAVFMGNTLLSVDLFNRTDIYSEYFPRILRSAAMETSWTTKERSPSALEGSDASSQLWQLFDRISSAHKAESAGVGVGTEHRFKLEDFAGSELRHDQHLVHFAACRSARA
jgi:hypothetical protein